MLIGDVIRDREPYSDEGQGVMGAAEFMAQKA